jgi:hypothetical protein
MAKCSNGDDVTEATIKAKLSKVYKKMYEGEPYPMCEGCGEERAQGSGHILPKSICKQLHLTELIWSPENIFPSCYKCNQICENVSSTEITKLLNYERIKEVLLKYCPSRASKLPE